MPSNPEDDICQLFGEDRIEDDNPYVTVKVMGMLASECIRDYENMWRPLFDGSDQRIGDMRPLLDVDDSLSEQSVAECHFDRLLKDWVKKAVHMFDKYFEYSARVEILRKVLKILHLQELEETFAESVQAFTSLEENNVDDLTLRQLFETGNILSQISEILQGELSNILEELSKSSFLVDFLRETALEDLRNLIDAVEEHSEQSVQESTVSALINVKRFLSPILRETPHSEVKHVLTMLQKSLTDSKITNLDQKISECNTHLHSLKALFHNVANRGEVTKEIVKKAVQQGSKYVFTLSQSGCDLNLKYRSHNTTRTHTHSDISDLRSRVMLMNTDVKEKGKAKKQDKIKEDFEIVETNIIGSTFYPEQLRQIENHFKAIHSKVDTEISDLLSFTGYDLKHLSGGNDIYSHVQEDIGHDAFGLKSVGKTLEILFQGKTTMLTPFPDTKSGRVADAVQEGELFLVGLNDDSDLVVPTLLALYKNTTRCLPMSSQVLFCQEDTLWEDIELLIRRCLGAKREKKPNQLFSIVCVENLSSELQFRLVDILETMEEESYLLAIICRGNAHHSFLDHFGENVHQVQPMSQSAMEECLQTLWPDVVTVLSDVPGQGKSEYIQELAWSKQKRVCSLHVSGEMTPKELVKKMSDLDLTSSDLLHIDIGMLSKPKEVDLLLTQLIVLGFVSHGSDLVKLTTKTICIEVANTISNSLRNSLNTVLCFRREVLKWQNYANFCVSNETCSPVQVVCHYLQAYDCGKLDTTDLYFTGEAGCRPLPQEKCTEMLKKYFSSGTDISFTLVRTFLNVLSDQLKKFSCSYFFRTTNISGMLGGDAHLKDVKSQLFRALLDVSREFATRSVHACREDQTASVLTMSQSADINQSVENLVATSASASAMTKRVEAMIQWEESNHLLIAFHNQDIQTLSALYRNKSLVPVHVKTLFETQVKAVMPEFSKLSQTELQDMLQRIARFKPGATSDKVKNHMSSSYALTPDNLLKMILIILRTRAHVPVIIIGETGCGKTSLIRYLSVICGVDLKIQNIHAGIVEDEIIRRVLEVNETALNSLDDVVWLFLDEINTCNHLGLINAILCHHTCHGMRLAPNLVVMAACNPYKIRSDQSIFTAGLETKVQADERSRLVYRVNPLPESMVDFVWDYGSLSDSDEKAYIKRMITGCVQQSLENCVVELLVMSQSFIREREHSGSCVSLRDVSRCRKLIDWFKKTLKEKEKLKETCFSSSIHMERFSVVLALAHSYHSRLPDTCSRQTYRQRIAMIFAKHLVSTTEHDILTIIQSEQRDILNRMELPQGTAKNTALQENVFVILVCILNHIPVFVVGKPGCSKSLSLQLIKSNLRGKDSKDPYFQSLPQLFCVSYQGSESSTSDGILKVFAKAEKYKENDKDNSVLPVVILDEIGLAEMSRFNPLKVLHSLLEPGETELPNVAVVGISNWALDAAKMNRAIHLSRPDMDAKELYLTGISISETSVSDNQKRMNLVQAIANAYLQYTGEQTFKNFHGLRDFYSLVKYVSKEFSALSDHDSVDSCVQLKIITKGLLRNFGGLSSEIHSVLTVYRKHLEKLLSVNFPEVEDIPSVLELVADNINDKSARHLLLSTRGESALSIIEDLLTEKNRKFVSILGSHFEEDLTDDYNYRILSKIILCMEQGVVLILKDLENIYGSLYDMLNQNYTIVGSKKNCRIALGAYSNPLCHVHDDFRCIVLVEEDKLDLSDPPFLNRFEKQYMKLTELLSQTEMKAVSVLEDWFREIASIQGHTFTRCDVIPIDSPDMVASLVHFVYSKQSNEPDSTDHMNMCKRMMLTMCSPESVVRMDLSELQKKDPNEVQELQDMFFHLPVHCAAHVYKIEAASAWDSVTLWCNTEDKDRKREVWLNLTRDKTMIDTESVPPPEGPECYLILDSVLSLRCPFSKVFIDQIETLKEPFMDAFRAEYSDFDIDEVNEEIKDTLTMRFQPTVSQAAMDMFENTYTDNQFTDYFHDFCNVIFSGIKLQMTEKQREKATERSILSRFTRKRYSFEYDVCSLHITCWLYGPVIESEVKLIDVCLDLTETEMADFLQSSNLSITATLSDSQKQANEGLKEVPSGSSEEHGALEKYVQDEDAEEQLDAERTSSVVDVMDIELESETESGDEICYQREDYLKPPTPDEIQYEDKPTSDEDESEMIKDKLSNVDEQPCADDCEDVNTAIDKCHSQKSSYH
ncbi:E3 ubiquitin-protein ligase rnf213-alpha-like [Haliotis rubra]|uniref:E3 ubiquitin-protein ligase rnf213-alpha-like n=1 Tax=Haliotis rubra TaxID=36100 RepID=UPI001EE5A25F|nr:E3 ubiquitin-protein ligase rnf213-alpha-like [Haliotis rubra]